MWRPSSEPPRISVKQLFLNYVAPKQVPYVNTINEWAEPNSALGLTANTVIDSNDSPPGTK